jgi:hypothetical protein
MADQTKIVGSSGTNGRTGAPRAVVENLSDFLHDVVTLSELQAKLFVADVNDFRSGAIVPGALLGAAAIIALGCVPVLLMAIAWLLIDYEVLSQGWAFLAATGIGVLLAVVLGITGWVLFRRNLAVLERSQLELQRNITWFKSVLKHSGRTTRDPNVVIRSAK